MNEYHGYNHITRLYTGPSPLIPIILDPVNQKATLGNTLPFAPERPANEHEVIMVNKTYDAWEYVQDFTGTVFQKSDGQPVQHTELGQLPSHLTIHKPASRWGSWNESDEQWVTDTKARQKDLCQQYCNQLDQFASRVRQRFISGQTDVIDEYKLAEEEALAFKALNYQGEVPESIQIDMDTYGSETKEATDRILAEANIMKSALHAVRAIRLPAKEAIKSLPESTTEEEFRAEFDKWQSELDAIKPPQ